jgi:hypothetical protein
MNTIDKENNSQTNNYAKCAVCKGDGIVWAMDNSLCWFCNSTGEFNLAADSFMKSHGCLCHLKSEAKHCILCGGTCHHSTDHRIVVRIDPR